MRQDSFDDARALLGKHAADEVKTLGEAMMLRCDSASEAIGFALRLVQEMGARHGFPSVRVGLHTGALGGNVAARRPRLPRLLPPVGVTYSPQRYAAAS